MDTPVVIAGGGVAGSLTALLLARQGVDVVLVEKERFPRHKVCGEYLSGECIPLLRDIGVLDSLSDIESNWMRYVNFYSPTGRKASFELPEGSRAFAIRRADLDERLLSLARDAGADVRTQTKILRHRVAGVDLQFELSGNQTLDAAFVVAADGIRSRFTHQDVKKNTTRLFGLKAYFRAPNPTPDLFEMFFNAGSYGGYSHMSADVANCAFIVEESLVKSLKGDCEQIYRQALLRHPVAREKWGDAVRVSDWFATGPVEYGVKSHFPSQVIPVGDALVTTEQFAGEGIGMAVKGAILLAEEVSRLGLTHWPDIRTRYLARHNEAFRDKIALLNLVRRSISTRFGAELIIGVLGLMPGLFNVFYDLTRSDYRRFQF